MAWEIAFEAAALADEQIGATRDFDQRFGPSGVARIRDGLAVAFETQRETRRPSGMGRGVRGHCQPGAFATDACPMRCRIDAELEYRRGRAREQRVAQRRETRLESFGSPDEQRPPALAHQLGIEQEEGRAAEMIAMEMSQHDAVDRIESDGRALQRDERGRAAIDQEAAAGAAYQKTGIEAAA